MFEPRFTSLMLSLFSTRFGHYLSNFDVFRIYWIWWHPNGAFFAPLGRLKKRFVMITGKGTSTVKWKLVRKTHFLIFSWEVLIVYSLYSKVRFLLLNGANMCWLRVMRCHSRIFNTSKYLNVDWSFDFQTVASLLVVFLLQTNGVTSSKSSWNFVSVILMNFIHSCGSSMANSLSNIK